MPESPLGTSIIDCATADASGGNAPANVWSA